MGAGASVSVGKRVIVNSKHEAVRTGAVSWRFRSCVVHAFSLAGCALPLPMTRPVPRHAPMGLATRRCAQPPRDTGRAGGGPAPPAGPICHRPCKAHCQSATPPAAHGTRALVMAPCGLMCSPRAHLALLWSTQVVKFVGKSELGSGTWIGVEMTKPVGNHDGAVKGKRYFTCKKGHGLMVRQDQVQVRLPLCQWHRSPVARRSCRCCRLASHGRCAGRAANAVVPVSLQPFSKEALASGTIGSAVKKHLHKRREELRMYNILDNHEEQVRGRARCTRVAASHAC